MYFVLPLYNREISQTLNQGQSQNNGCMNWCFLFYIQWVFGKGKRLSVCVTLAYYMAMGLGHIMEIFTSNVSPNVLPFYTIFILFCVAMGFWYIPLRLVDVFKTSIGSSFKLIPSWRNWLALKRASMLCVRARGHYVLSPLIWWASRMSFGMMVTYEVGFTGFLETGDGNGLELKVKPEVLGYLSCKMLEGELPYKQ